MRSLLVQRGKSPQVVDIENDLNVLQDTVGGYIETLYLFNDGTVIVCAEEGKLMGFAPNRCVRDDTGRLIDVLCGDFLVVGKQDDDFADLTEEQADKYATYWNRKEVIAP